MDLELLFQEMVSTASVGAFVTGVLTKNGSWEMDINYHTRNLRDLP